MEHEEKNVERTSHCQHLNTSESALPNETHFLYIKRSFVFTITVVGTEVTVITEQYNIMLIGSKPLLYITQCILFYKAD